MKLYLDGAVEIEYLLELLDHDMSYIKLCTKEYETEGIHNMDKFLEIDDMLVCNDELTTRLKNLAKTKGIDLCS